MDRLKLNYYFILSVTIIVFLKILQFPSLTIHAQPFAETATNFFYIAYEKNLWQNFLTPDAGYIPFLERIIAIIAFKGFHLTTQFMVVIQMIATILVGVFSSVITLSAFRHIFRSDLLRFLLAIAIGFIPDYQLMTFINFPYYGFVPIFLLLFVNKEKIKGRHLILLFCFLLLLILSKPHFLLFLPIFAFVSFFAFRKKLLKTAWFYLGGVAAFLLQILSVLFHPFAFAGSSHRSVIKKIAESIYSLLSMYRHAFLNDHLFANIPGFLFFVLLLGVFFFMFVKKQLLSRNQFPLYFFILCNYFAIFSTILTIGTISAIFPPGMPFFALPNDRHFFFTNVAVLFAGVMMMQTLIKKQWVLVLIVFILLFTSNAFFYPFDKEQQFKIIFTSFDQYPKAQMSYAQWEYTASVLQNKDYCIPVNPFPWLLHNNCDYLNHFLEVQNTTQKMEVFDLSTKYPESSRWQIRSIILINIPTPNSFKILTILAYDKNNKLLGKAQQLSPDSSYNYVYFYFPKKISSVERFVFLENNTPIAIIPDFMFFGTK